MKSRWSGLQSSLLESLTDFSRYGFVFLFWPLSTPTKFDGRRSFLCSTHPRQELANQTGGLDRGESLVTMLLSLALFRSPQAAGCQFCRFPTRVRSLLPNFKQPKVIIMHSFFFFVWF